MQFYVFIPLILIIGLQWLTPGFSQLLAQSFPGAVYGLLFLAASLTAIMRQWRWLYSLALIFSHYLVVQNTLQQALTVPEAAAMYLFMPVVISLLMLGLQFIKIPQLPTKQGFALLAGLILIPLCFQWVGLENLIINQTLPAFFSDAISTDSRYSVFLLLFVICSSLGCLAALYYYQASSQEYSKFAAWFSLMLFYLNIEQASISGWMTLAACFCLLVSLSNQMLKLAYIDELTQLPQRRALMSHLNRLSKQSAVTMLDVDHFKKFNDTWGHDVGDQVLKLIASILSKTKGVKAYRYGGEEFTLVFNHNDPEVIAERLEYIRSRVANYPLVFRQASRPHDHQAGMQNRNQQNQNVGKILHVSVSLGCAIRRPDEKPEPLLKRADIALYEAKKAGRNKVMFADKITRIQSQKNNLKAS
ncbi:GGDEF domain-containing protein [Catenovulum sp. 2E275]|uniref:GGDEF domain-containing protein n=1 Tax=Catenovulum sp. 2E275 TaxID=2980497 RepID=UPI0021CEA5A4|nr:GGDEF domain-containing protein [Catenovulum sp. 2E275]MCU4677074.1 GGDEF domain-containing protein [Catenovulum sp. 2E275]